MTVRAVWTSLLPETFTKRAFVLPVSPSLSTPDTFTSYLPAGRARPRRSRPSHVTRRYEWNTLYAWVSTTLPAAFRTRRVASTISGGRFYRRVASCTVVVRG